MTCARYRTALSARLDGELGGDAPDAAGLDRHLAACAGCRRWAADAERLRALGRTAPGPAPEWTDRLLAELSRAREDRGTPRGPSAVPDA